MTLSVSTTFAVVVVVGNSCGIKSSITLTITVVPPPPPPSPPPRPPPPPLPPNPPPLGPCDNVPSSPGDEIKNRCNNCITAQSQSASVCQTCALLYNNTGPEGGLDNARSCFACITDLGASCTNTYSCSRPPKKYPTFIFSGIPYSNVNYTSTSEEVSRCWYCMGTHRPFQWQINTVPSSGTVSNLNASGTEPGPNVRRYFSWIERFKGCFGESATPPMPNKCTPYNTTVISPTTSSPSVNDWQSDCVAWGRYANWLGSFPASILTWNFISLSQSARFCRFCHHPIIELWI